MKKIISLFQRNYDGDRLVRDEIVPGAEWVIAGEGVATRKWDGTCCMVRGGKLFKRYDSKHGKQPPSGFEPAQDPDPVTGHWPGWLPVEDKPEDRWHREAWRNSHEIYSNPSQIMDDGTYELIGPPINKNPEGLDRCVLVAHGVHIIADASRSYDSIKAFLSMAAIEGIVWHHPDGRMVKIKAKDFGIKRRAP